MIGSRLLSVGRTLSLGSLAFLGVFVNVSRLARLRKVANEQGHLTLW
jgi:hypothetical protein